MEKRKEKEEAKRQLKLMKENAKKMKEERESQNSIVQKEKNVTMFTKLKNWILNPPSFVKDEKERLTASLASDWREIVIIDLIIFSFLLASIHQLAFVFGRGEITLTAILKAVGIDGAIWILSRAASKRIANGKGNFLTMSFLWIGILVFLALTTVVNTLFEIWDKTAYPGNIEFVLGDTDLVLFTKMIGSTFLAVIILFLTFVRAILNKNMEKSIEGIGLAEEKAEEKAKKGKKGKK